MELEEHADAPAFLVAAASVLDADEARHNLIYGICSTLVDVPDAYPEARLWTIRDDSVVGAALMTPPFNIVVARPLDEEALRFAAHALHERSLRPPGVTGAIPEVDVFADGREQRTSTTASSSSSGCERFRTRRSRTPRTSISKRPSSAG